MGSGGKLAHWAVPPQRQVIDGDSWGNWKRDGGRERSTFPKFMGLKVSMGAIVTEWLRGTKKAHLLVQKETQLNFGE